MVRELALANGGVTNDTFLLSYVIMNIFRKCAQHFWKKHPSNPISVRMWTLEKPCNVFFYQDHSLMDLNCTTQNGVPFNLKIQTEWQSDDGKVQPQYCFVNWCEVWLYPNTVITLSFIYFFHCIQLRLCPCMLFQSNTFLVGDIHKIQLVCGNIYCTPLWVLMNEGCHTCRHFFAISWTWE